jgi:hypothetical protein
VLGVDELPILEAHGCFEAAHGVYSRLLHGIQKSKAKGQDHLQEAQQEQQPEPGLQRGQQQEHGQAQRQEDQWQDRPQLGQAQFQQQAEQLVHQAAALTRLAVSLVQGSWEQHVQHQVQAAATAVGVTDRLALYQVEVSV